MGGREQIIRSGRNELHVYEWKTSLAIFEKREIYYSGKTFHAKYSPYFVFWGLYCQLYCEPFETTHLNHITTYVRIVLNGYPALLQMKVSCNYSISLTTINGEAQFTKEGNIHFSEYGFDSIIDQQFPLSKLSHNESFTISFSWCEDDGFSSDQVKENNKFLEILSKDLASLYDGKKDPDCVLKVDKIEFPVHRSILAARSSVFEAMFHHDTSESRSGEVNIQDVDPSVFGDVLYYIYSGKIRGLSPDTAASMYAVSDKYALTDFREKCLDFLKKNLTMENVCDAALLAHTHAETVLENEVLKFIEERLEDLLQDDKWRNFSDTHFKLANHLLGLSFMACKKKKKDDMH